MVQTKKEKNKYQLEYRKTFNGVKSHFINTWKTRGVKSEDYDLLYEYYFSITNCEKCLILLTTGGKNKRTTKCLDHNHLTGDFRNVLCMSCNSNDRLDNTSGIPNIMYCKTSNRWKYQKRVNKNTHTKGFLTKEEAILYKEEYEASLYAQNPT